MRPSCCGMTIALCLVLGVSTYPASDQTPTPAEQYASLLKEFQNAASSGKVLNDEQRMKFIGEVYKLRTSLGLKFIALAEKYPNDPIAVDALLQAIWQVNGTPWPVEIVGQDVASGKALALLERDHIRSAKLGTACERLSGGFRQEYEPFLRAVVDENPHRDVRGQACLSLAHFLANRLQRLDLIQDQPALGKEFADLFGKEYLADLQRRDRAKTEDEAERFFERALRDFRDVPLSDGVTVGERATAELFELRHLTVGKQAPDIEGVDQDGQKFKLRDYRGKVVLLDFWQEY